MIRFRPSSPADRDDAAAFAGRVARWDALGPVRLRTPPAAATGTEPQGTVTLWATTPFDTLVTRSVDATVDPRDVTVRAGNLLAALAVVRDPEVDPGPPDDAAWRSQLPPPVGWVLVDSLPAREVTELADRGVAAARESAAPSGGAPASLLDGTVLTARGRGMDVSVPMRVLFALSGMGFATAEPDELVHVRATDAWLRIDARFGAVVRRRQALLPLFV
ncbi:hypothetical protein [Nakamurella endophytica]|uniref:Uncharacterized protein n=1 Tax=Nakamurella endophytica TaxID=1748367 RepID=A0A917T2H1_9ACTN|nr:hypothetical protein [Nakamurella endophytica]GGM06938.1 hypothetical protein GCM10011594_28700 [Nakamurella endophytica]